VRGAVIAAVLGPLPLASAGVTGPVGKADRWTVSWATSQHVAGSSLTDQSVRMIVHLTQGGDAVRVRIGNTLGTSSLRLGGATVGLRRTGGQLVPGSVRRVTFNGRRAVSVPAGKYVVSDPVAVRTRPQEDVAVSMFVPGTVVPSAHGSAFETGYLTAAGAGDRTGDASAATYTQTTGQYLMVDAVDVRNPHVRGAVVVTGGSVTDGTGSDKTGPGGSGPAAPPNSRWSDVFSRRVLNELPPDAQLAVAEAGVAGNTASRACQIPPLAGPYSDVEDRLDRDVFSLTNVKYLVVYAGTNDVGIGTGCSADEIIGAFKDIAQRAHRHGIRVVVSTVTPREHYTVVQNQARHLVNAWVTRWNRCGGWCDGTVNFDAAISWFANPNAMDPVYDSGDDIHPNAEGYALMGRTMDMDLFRSG